MSVGQGGSPLHLAFATPEFVTEESFDGGLASYLDRVTRALKERGHRPEVFVLADRDESFDAEGVRVVRVARHPPFRSLLRLRCASQLDEPLESYLLRRALMAVHARDPLDLVQYASYRSTGLHRFGVPSVVRISSYSPLWREAYGSPTSRRDRRRDRYEARALRRADAVFGPSTALAGVIEGRLGVPVRILESPFEPWGGRPDASALEASGVAGRPFLLHFGTLGRLKGTLVIADVLAELLGRHPELGFVFIGKDLAHRGRSTLERLREAAGPYGARVHCLPPMRHEQLYAFVQAAKGVVLPSLVDNFPNACLEAMSQRRVVIGTAGASFEQLIDDGRNGLLARPGDPASLLAACEILLGLSAERRRAIGDAALATIGRLRADVTVAALEDFYRATIAATGAGEKRRRSTPREVTRS